MAITPSQWSHVLTIPESYTPTAVTSGQTLVITESVIAKLSAGDQTTFWSNVQNGGGDVRICADSAGTNQLPVEIVSLDNVAETCVIWTRKATYAGNGELYVFIGKAGETQPAVTDPFGRNAVWVDYEISAQLNESPSTAPGHYVNSSGKANGTSPDPLQNNTIGPYGALASDLDGTTDQIDFPVSNLGEVVTFSAWAKCDSLSVDQRLISLFNSNLADNDARSTLLWMDSGEAGDGWAGFIRNTNGSSYRTSVDLKNATLSWQHITMVCTATSLEVFVDGQSVSTASVLGESTIPLVNTFIIGRNWDLFNDGNFFDGGVSDARLSKGTLTPALIATDYENQNDPASFYGTPTIAATGGGEAVDAPITGVQANALLGNVVTTGSAVASTSGVFATGQVGDVSITTAQRVVVTGVQADASLGDIDVEIKTIIRVEGVSASAQAGRVNVWGAIQVAQDANWSNMNIPSSGNWSPIDY